MIARTFSFWRRLVGKTPPAQTPSERRLWVRYPADLETKVESADSPVPDNRVSARVRDISRGGANLLVDRPFETGQMLSLEFGEGADVDTVLACIVRTVPEGKGQWALGCVFSRQLTDDDLEGSGAQRVRHPASDKRIWVRFATNLKASYQKVGDPDDRTYSAQVINLSASGVGLAVSTAVAAGALLSVDLLGAEDKPVRTILACVVHVSTQASGGCALGCNFIRELTENDLKALI